MLSFNLMLGAFEEGFIYAIVALGLYISYKVLGIADLSTDGTFVLGAAVSTMVVISGHPFLALPVAVLAGMCAGFVTAFLQTRLGVPSILAGIITMTALYSVNLFIQKGKPNRSFMGDETVFTYFENLFGKKFGTIALLIIIVVLIIVLMTIFFKTHLGLSIRATGNNEEMVKASSINPKNTITVGLCLSNGLTSLGGALIAQYNTFGDISIGTGIVVISLASLVIGDVFFRKNKVAFKAIGAVVGAIIYRIIFTIALRYTDAGYLKFVSAAILAVVIAYPTVVKYVKGKLNIRREMKSYEQSQD